MKRGDYFSPEVAAALMMAAEIAEDGGGGAEPLPNRLVYVKDDTDYHNPVEDLEDGSPMYNGPYDVWKNQVPADFKARCDKVLFLDEDFDSVTELYYSPERDGTYLDDKTRVIGIGLYHRDEEDEEVTRLIFPDGTFVLTEGF